MGRSGSAFTNTRSALRLLGMSQQEFRELCRSQPWLPPLLSLWGALPFAAAFAATAFDNGSALAAVGFGLFFGMPLSAVAVLLGSDVLRLAGRLRFVVPRITRWPRNLGLTADIDRDLARMARLLAACRGPLSQDETEQLARLKHSFARLKELRAGLAQRGHAEPSPLRQEADYAESLVEAYTLASGDLSELDSRLAEARAVKESSKGSGRDASNQMN